MQTIQFENAVEQSTGGNQAVPTISYFSSRNNTRADGSINWDKLVELAARPSIRPKDAAIAIVPHNGSAKTKVVAEQSLFSVLVADLDDKDYDIERVTSKLHANGYFGAHLIYTTSSHQQEGKGNRYRLVIPLAEPVEAGAYLKLAQGLCSMLDAGVEQARVQQYFYGPNKERVNSPYEHRVHNGDYLAANIGFCEVLRTKAAEAIKTVKTPNKPDNQIEHSKAVKQLSSKPVIQVEGGKIGGDFFEALPADCKPMKFGERHDKIFMYTRYLKEEFKGATPKQLLPYVKGWFDYFIDNIGTKDFTVTLGDFQTSFETSKIPYGQGVKDIIENLGSTELPALINQHIELMEYEKGTINLIKLCYLLSGAGGVFYLGLRDAAQTVGCKSHNTANSHIKALVAVELLEVVEKGTRGSRGKATTYRWLADEEGNF